MAKLWKCLLFKIYPQEVGFHNLVSISKESLEQLRQKVDLVDLLSSYIDLKRSGAYHKACCPFHEERTPSFVVQPGSSFYHCFGCQAHGDAISFLMDHQRLSFSEAVELLAERYQIVLEYEQTSEKTKGKKVFMEAIAKAQEYFHEKLLTSKEGNQALDYLSKRGIDLDFVKKFELGLAPKEGKALAEILLKIAPKNELIEIGLLNQYGSSFFYDRITFPIRNAQGAVVGFSARLFKESTTGGKYINSKESFIFKKSHLFFGLNYSRMRLAKGKKVLLVEGQIDALRLIDHGLNATLAPLGTALTESHVEKLVQLGVEKAYIAFDSDDAGMNAALKSGHLLQKKKITTYIVPMPKKYDPDSYVQKYGAKAFGELLNKKVDYLAFVVRYLSKNSDMSDPAQKARLIEKITNKIKEWEDPVMVHESLKKVASLMQVPESMLGLSEVGTTQKFSASSASLKPKKSLAHQYLETDVLVWLVQKDLPTEKLLKIAVKNLPANVFENSQCASLYQIIIEKLQKHEEIDSLSLLIESPDEKTQKLLSWLMEKKIHKEHAEKLFVNAVQHLLDHRWMQKREEIKLKLQSGLIAEDDALKLAKQFDDIQKNRPQVALDD